MSRKLIAGVLALQGDIEQHVEALKIAISSMEIEGNVILVKDKASADEVDLLVIPGGESTVIGSLSSIKGLLPLLRERISAGLPTLGTCAGMIMLASKAYDRVVGLTNQSLIGLMDITVERNAFGRQKDSFEATLDLDLPGGKNFRAVFIRAPLIKSVGARVRTLAEYDGNVVAAIQDNMLVTSFHPELSENPVVHKYLVEIALKRKELN
jgi:5'-phosphate synthase pdxT subunit